MPKTLTCTHLLKATNNSNTFINWFKLDIQIGAIMENKRCYGVLNVRLEGPVICNALYRLLPRLDALALLENPTIGLIPEELEQMSWHLKFTKLKANVECGIPNSKCETL